MVVRRTLSLLHQINLLHFFSRGRNPETADQSASVSIRKPEITFTDAILKLSAVQDIKQKLGK
jgi:hypothetical protein